MTHIPRSEHWPIRKRHFCQFYWLRFWIQTKACLIVYFGIFILMRCINVSIIMQLLFQTVKQSLNLNRHFEFLNLELKSWTLFKGLSLRVLCTIHFWNRTWFVSDLLYTLNLQFGCFFPVQIENYRLEFLLFRSLLTKSSSLVEF